MRINSNYRVFNGIRNIFRKSQPKISDSGTVLSWAENQIQPLQDTFASTKDMFAYARQRCIEDLVGESPKEHALVLDLKRNRVLAEYVGTSENCDLSTIASLAIDSKNTAVFHGHPDFMPLSPVDIKFLLHYQINQIVAINEKGEFSIMAKTSVEKTKRELKKAFKSFALQNLVNAETWYDKLLTKPMYRREKHDILKRNADKMGLRYLTNYAIFRQQ